MKIIMFEENLFVLKQEFHDSLSESINCCSSLSTSVIKRSLRDLLIYSVKRLSSLGTNTPCFGLGGMNI